MEGVRKMDYFRKVSGKYAKSTTIGGILSVVAVIAIIVLVFQEIWYFSISPSTRKEVQINSDYDTNPEIELEFSLVFQQAPCALINVSIQQRGLSSPVRQLKKTRLDLHKKSPIKPGVFGKAVAVQNYADKLSQMEKEILSGILERQLCEVEGSVSAQRVPGTLVFTLGGGPTVAKLKTLSKWVRPLSTAHTVKYFYAGIDSKHLKRIDRKYGGKGSADFNRGAEMIFDTSSGDDALLYSYYLEMVPHVYKVHGRDKKGRIGYKYSLSSKSKTLGPGEASETRISYKISPLTVIHEGQSSTISKFLVHLCAIVGGVFVVIGLLNKLLSGK